MAMYDFSKVKPSDLSVTVGWEEADGVTPWKRMGAYRLPVMHRFTKAEINEFWAANKAAGFTLDAGEWYRSTRNITL